MRESISDEVYCVHSSLGRPRPLFFCVTDLFLSQVSQEEAIITMFFILFLSLRPFWEIKDRKRDLSSSPGPFLWNDALWSWGRDRERKEGRTMEK